MAELTFNQIREVALGLTLRTKEVFDLVYPLYSTAQTWDLEGDDSALPAVSELKTVLLAYEVLRKPDLTMKPDVLNVKLSDDDTIPIDDLPGAGMITPDIFYTEHLEDATHDGALLNFLTESQAGQLTDGRATLLHAHNYNNYELEVHGDEFHGEDVPRFAFVQWTGNGTAGHVVGFSPAFVPRVIIRMQGGTSLGFWFTSSTNYMHLADDVSPNNYVAANNVTAVGSGTLTLPAAGSFNASGVLYEALIF